MVISFYPASAGFFVFKPDDTQKYRKTKLICFCGINNMTCVKYML